LTFRRSLLALVGILAAASVGAATVSLARFTDAVADASTVTAAASFDIAPPTIEESVISKVGESMPGFIRQGGTYQLYATVIDSGSAASGVGTVSADVSAITAGQSTVPLIAGSYSIGGVPYGYRSGILTADAALAAGSIAYTLSASDVAGNVAGPAAFSVVVDNTQPWAMDVQTANGGVTAGTPEEGDSITFTFSEPIDPASVLAGWSGASTPVVVHIVDGGPLGNDTFTVWDAGSASQLALGSVDLAGSGYVPADRSFGATGSASLMTATGSAITVVLGTPSGSTGSGPPLGANMIWSPSLAAIDAAGNGCETAPATESDGLATDQEF